MVVHKYLIQTKILTTKSRADNLNCSDTALFRFIWLDKLITQLVF